MLDTEQREELKNALRKWRAGNPSVRAVAFFRFHDLAQAVGGTAPGQPRRGLFSLIGLDPLAGLDPAVRELTQTRQLAERAIYYMQRWPTVLDMAVELLTFRMAVMPEARSLLGDIDTAARAADSAGTLADALPAVIAREREAAIAQFMAGLDAQQDEMRGLAHEIRGLLDAGTATSDSIRKTIGSLDTFVAHLEANAAFVKRAPSRDEIERPSGDATGNASSSDQASSAADGRPFDITEYSDALRELAATSRELERLVGMLATTTPQLTRTLDVASANAKDIVHFAFVRLLLLIVAVTAAILAVLLVARSKRHVHTPQ